MGVNATFIYPRNGEDPPSEEVRASFRLKEGGFESALGSVQGTLYAGRTSAGGQGRSIDCDGDGKPDAIFNDVCQFVLQLREGKILAIEADRKTAVQIRGKRIALDPYLPVRLGNE
jgi:hypothetical protein